jgi:hypothetical protein
MGKQIWILIAFAVVITGVKSYGEFEAPSLKWGGFVSLREGQIVKGEKETIIKTEAKNTNVWVQEMNLGLSLEAAFRQIPATGNIALEVAVNNDYSPAPQDLGQTRRLNYYLFIHRADLLFDVIDNEALKLVLDVGYFPFKYNSSVRNLGEYLFRSGTYPQYLITEVDFPMARLMGLHFDGAIGEKFDFDVLLTTNIEWTAIGDVNLSGLLAWKPHPLIEIGLGGSWCSMISVDLDYTTPQSSGGPTRYLGTPPGSNDTAIYNYTFAGHKIMGRMTLDLKQIFPGRDVFGEEDLKLYSEAAILGVLNYPASMDNNQWTNYDTLWQRIPVMVGLNIPTFKLLDVLSIEVEWFGNQYVNNLNPLIFDNSPIPLSLFQGEQSEIYRNQHDDDWKWSVHAKKTIAGNFFIMAQAASDHIRWYRLNYSQMDGKEALRRIDQWYYTFKFGYAF